MRGARGWCEGHGRSRERNDGQPRAWSCAADSCSIPTNRAFLVLYDVSTLDFETDTGDGFREPGFSKERRLEPQITIGLLTDAAGFPLQAESHGGCAGWVRVRKGLEWGAGVHAGPVPSCGHVPGGAVRFETWQGHVGPHFGEQPHVAFLGKEQLQMIRAPAARQIPRPHPHRLILPAQTRNRCTTGQRALRG